MPGVYPDPASLGVEPQGMFAMPKNSGSGFNPNATPFIPTFVHRLPGQPVAAATGDPSPQGLMGVPLDQLPRGGVVQSPHMQAMYANQFSLQQVSNGGGGEGEGHFHSLPLLWTLPTYRPSLTTYPVLHTLSFCTP